MKVKIGKYKSWFGPYQLAEKLMFWVPREVDEYGFPHTADRVHRFGEWLAYGNFRPEPKAGEVYDIFGEDRKPTLLHRFLIWLHGKQDQTIKVHIDRWDTWSMDTTLAYIVLPMLKQLKATKHGAPHVDLEDVPEHLHPTQEELDAYNKDGTTDDKFFERWDWIFDEMIFAFETKAGDLQDWEEQFTTGEYDFQWKKLEDGNSQMVHGPNHTAETDWDARNAYGKRIENGFRLFGKYYQSLWD